MSTPRKPTSVKAESASKSAAATRESISEAMSSCGTTAATAYISTPVKKAAQTMHKNFDEITTATTAMTETLFKASTNLFKLAEDLNRSWLAFGKKAMETHVAATKELMGVKSLPELLEKQSCYAKSSFDNLMAETSKLSEMTVKVGTEALAPIKERVTETVERFTKAA